MRIPERRCIRVPAYEFLFICRPDLLPEQIEAVIEKIKKPILESNGTVVSIDRWGKRKLAFEVKGFQEGDYICVRFFSPPEVITKLQHIYRVSSEIIRELIIKLPKKEESLIKKGGTNGTGDSQ